jgi:hypothetical protein
MLKYGGRYARCDVAIAFPAMEFRAMEFRAMEFGWT